MPYVLVLGGRQRSLGQVQIGVWHMTLQKVIVQRQVRSKEDLFLLESNRRRVHESRLSKFNTSISLPDWLLKNITTCMLTRQSTQKHLP